jgi:Family of unknown function (DUF6165)
MIMAPISIGELIDKITILQIKQQEFTDPERLNNVQTELAELQKLSKSIKFQLDDIATELYDVNYKIWLNEDKARTFTDETHACAELATIAYNTYKLNQRRAEIKKSINTKTGSIIVEAKSYV